MIFNYWAHHMNLNDDDIRRGHSCNDEGVSWYDGYNATFWYLLNVEWYRMQNKLYAKTNCAEPFDEYLRDFDEDYLTENNYV